MTILVAALLSICLNASPDACQRHTVHIERKACGVSYRLEIEVAGAWQPGVARVECGRG